VEESNDSPVPVDSLVLIVGDCAFLGSVN